MAYDDQDDERYGGDRDGPASDPFRPAETPEQQYAQPRWAEARTGNVPTDTRESARGRWLFAGAVALVALAVGVAAGAVLPERGDDTFSLPASAKIEAFDEEIVQAVYERSVSAVAQVEVAQRRDEIFPFFQREQGSAFLIDKDGRFITNSHVVTGAPSVTVILEDGTRLRGEVSGMALSNDLAVVRVDPQRVRGIVPLPLGDSELVEPGQLAIAIGSPYGLQSSVTVGVVSGVNRTLPSDIHHPIQGMIQTDAAIFPGSSGGPLLNSRGEVIGVNTAVVESGGDTIGFAVPSNSIAELLERMAAGMETGRPWLGVTLLTLNEETANDLGLETDAGIYITDVVEDSPAEQGGLRTGDVIIGAGGDEIARSSDLVAFLEGKRPGNVVTIDVHRDGSETSITVTLGTWPDSLS